MVTGIPVIERLRSKGVGDEAKQTLDLSNYMMDLMQVGDDLWDVFNGLDREALIQQTPQLLAEENRSAGLTELAALLPPVHDLETFVVWTDMVRETDIEATDSQRELAELSDGEGRRWRSNLPTAGLENQALIDIGWE